MKILRLENRFVAQKYKGLSDQKEPWDIRSSTCQTQVIQK